MFKSSVTFVHQMLTPTLPPQHVITSFQQIQTELGGDFNCRLDLCCPIAFRHIWGVADRRNAPKHITRLVLSEPGNILVHPHGYITRHFEILRSFGDVYGHLTHCDSFIDRAGRLRHSAPSLHRLEELQGTFSFGPQSIGRIVLLRGFLIARFEIEA
jgi:hypothetical protein